MAEFKDVHRNMVRMCDAMRAEDNGCAPCPLDGICAKFITPSEDAIAMIERVVTQWAAEHPEPVYPSWEAAWRQLFPDANCVPCPDSFGIKYGVPECAHLACTACKSRPIPAEVAEKLGIKPISRQSEDVHNGCIGCKYEKRSVFEAPCAQCRGWTMITCDPNRRGVLWEAAK